MSMLTFNITVFFAVVGTGLWYYIKYILKQNGYETHLFWGHSGDIVNLHRLMGKEQDAGLKKRYRILLIAFYSAISLFLIGGVLNFL